MNPDASTKLLGKENAGRLLEHSVNDLNKLSFLLKSEKLFKTKQMYVSHWKNNKKKHLNIKKLICREKTEGKNEKKYFTI